MHFLRLQSPGPALWAAAFCAVAGLAAARADAAPVTVDLRSGQSVAGEVDARSDAAKLFLRIETDRYRIVRAMPWSQIAAVRQDDVALTTEQVLALATPASRELLWRAEDAAAPPVEGPAQGVAPPGAGIVRAIYIDAFVANWNADVPVDGIVVALIAVDRYGQVVPVSGTLEIELYGFRAQTLRLAASVDRLGHWSVAVRPDEFGPNGFIAELPFQGVQPEFNVQVAPKGLVRARLAVPGQGVFETSQTDVRLRPYSAFRDRLQQRTGERFLPGEATPGSTLRNRMPSR